MASVWHTLTDWTQHSFPHCEYFFPHSMKSLICLQLWLPTFHFTGTVCEIFFSVPTPYFLVNAYLYYLCFSSIHIVKDAYFTVYIRDQNVRLSCFFPLPTAHFHVNTYLHWNIPFTKLFSQIHIASHTDATPTKSDIFLSVWYFSIVTTIFTTTLLAERVAKINHFFFPQLHYQFFIFDSSSSVSCLLQCQRAVTPSLTLHLFPCWVVFLQGAERQLMFITYCC